MVCDLFSGIKIFQNHPILGFFSHFSCIFSHMVHLLLREHGGLTGTTGALRPEPIGSPPVLTANRPDSALFVNVSHHGVVVSPHQNMSAPYQGRKVLREPVRVLGP